jgi:predicted nucleic acid-binding protein
VKYIVDASVLLAVARGEWVKIQLLGWHKKRDVAVPEPVVAHTAVEVRRIPKPAALERWTKLVDAMPRAVWTPAVTAKLLELAAADVDAITAAHALAFDAAVLTMDQQRYPRIEGLRVDEL